MGLNWHGVKFLASVRSGGTDFERMVTIGRQNLHVSLLQVQQILDSYDISHHLDDVPASPEFLQSLC